MEVRDDVPADNALHLLPLIHVPLPAQGCSYVIISDHSLIRVSSKQCFGSGFSLVSGSVSGIGIQIQIQEGKNDPQNQKKFRNFMF